MLILLLHKTKKLIVIDDSKSENLSCYALLTDILSTINLEKKIILKRNLVNTEWLNPVDDQMEINFQEVVNDFIN